MSEVGDSIIKIVNTIVDERIKEIKRTCDKTFKTVIIGKNPNGACKINYNNKEYTLSNATGIDLNVGQLVWVKIPSGVFRNMHICGVNYKKKKRR